jgi:hypothetical protein
MPLRTPHANTASHTLRHEPTLHNVNIGYVLLIYVNYACLAMSYSSFQSPVLFVARRFNAKPWYPEVLNTQGLNGPAAWDLYGEALLKPLQPSKLFATIRTLPFCARTLAHR